MLKTTIKFQPLKSNLYDYLILTKWLKNPEVLEWYEGKKYTLKKTISKFREHILGFTDTKPFFIVINNKKIGYIQYYILRNDEKAFFEFSESLTIIGFDLFIANKKDQNRGLGTIVIKNFIKFVRKELKPDIIIADPQEDNLRAIRCWEKCGFVKQKLLVLFEVYNDILKNNWLMVLNVSK